MFKKLVGIFIIFFISSCAHQNQIAKNIVIMIVDGMGFNYIKAANISFDDFTCKTKVTTCSIDGADENGLCRVETDNITDSAAAATAIATGQKVKNGVISKDLVTILERSAALNKSTGIVVTKLISDATPAAFASHANNRKETDSILYSMFNKVKPNIVIGADNEMHKAYAKKAHYKIVDNKDKLFDLLTHKNIYKYIYAGFGQHELIPGIFKEVIGLPLEITPTDIYDSFNIPHLSESTFVALELLKSNPNGFFLMVESSMPDVIGHNSHIIDNLKNAPKAIEVLIKEMKEVLKTSLVLKNFIKENPDTLVILTADHETGGLSIDEKSKKVSWLAPKYLGKNLVTHTNADVPLYALGQGAEHFCKDYINNTDIYRIIQR